MVKRVLQEAAPISVVVQYLEDENFDTPEVKALTRALISEMKQVAENNPLFSEEMRLSMVNIDHPGKIADFITSILNIDRAEQQKILEMTDVQARMEHVLIFIKKEQELLKIQKKIQEQLSEKISKSQREYFLKEELKAIKAELGMAVDAKTSEYQRFKDAVEKLALRGRGEGAGRAGAGEVLPDGAELPRVHRDAQLPGDHHRASRGTTSRRNPSTSTRPWPS